eukprot:TRINITY_DN2165_c0_g1_i7.p4 TRINITY_DN2165_c0_g1~~TRINITY_DN2165_c0_g1_i7.p4  ORF type:complete len:104 (+),score=5.70 TRINITY_DN2165_c0_g1_i7:489-800(+)
MRRSPSPRPPVTRDPLDSAARPEDAEEDADLVIAVDAEASFPVAEDLVIAVDAEVSVTAVDADSEVDADSATVVEEDAVASATVVDVEPSAPWPPLLTLAKLP